jgi:hypothetical protein
VYAPPVHGQARNEVLIFVEPTTGGEKADRDFFDENIRMELSAANYAIAPVRAEADYLLEPSIVVREEPDGPPTRSVLLRLLRNDAARTELVQTGISYTVVTDTYEWNLYLIYQLMANVPVTKAASEESREPEVLAPPEDWAWKNKWLYLGLQAIVASGFYGSETEDFLTVGLAYGAGLSMELQFVHLYWPGNYLSLSIETGANLMMDNFGYQEIGTDAGQVNSAVPRDIMTLSLLTPAVLKLNYKPGYFALGLYAGAYYLLPLNSSGIPLPLNAFAVAPPFGLTAGLKAGVKAGRAGVLSLNIRFSMDQGLSSTLEDLEEDSMQFQRSLLSFGIGYEFGLFNRKGTR